ncbi:cytochrome c oxidase assembly protein CtaG [Maritalea myrionectae]|uniref:Cytochrome c oxidase assembly protein CtaG n=1 Tax=Maritalea myrionectae TaxID=454601 RepID=A0A2R4MHD5_9HYPH|nr:cytochrome c oxidase assembly protein [Maritalea myrionectae]AVX05284.1 cytochrome c oxidase assembly protein CtaG [Maritalea myrionectae]
MAHVDTQHHGNRSNKRIAYGLVLVVALMVGMAYAAVPLYQIFCQVTGYGGTTQRAEDGAISTIDREMAVRFAAQVDADLPVKIVPAATQVDKIGKKITVTYEATNLTDEPVKTVASFNVTPASMGAYFNKIECFCFTEQTLAPNETVQMPVLYYLDPELDLNDELDTIREITLFYAFHAS